MAVRTNGGANKAYGLHSIYTGNTSLNNMITPIIPTMTMKQALTPEQQLANKVESMHNVVCGLHPALMRGERPTVNVVTEDDIYLHYLCGATYLHMPDRAAIQLFTIEMLPSRVLFKDILKLEADYVTNHLTIWLK